RLCDRRPCHSATTASRSLRRLPIPVSPAGAETRYRQRENRAGSGRRRIRWRTSSQKRPLSSTATAAAHSESVWSSRRPPTWVNGDYLINRRRRRRDATLILVRSTKLVNCSLQNDGIQ